jgi:hypothetical protein
VRVVKLILENNMARIQLWVDDQRLPPSDFNTHAKTYAEAIKYLESGKVVSISLDHDLGEEMTGYDIAKWIEEKAFHDEISRIRWTVHSANPIGAARIAQALKNADMFWKLNR